MPKARLAWVIAGLVLLTAAPARADSPITLKAGATAPRTELESAGMTLGGALSGPRWRPFSDLLFAPQLELIFARRHTGLVPAAGDSSYTLDFFEVPLLLRAEFTLGGRSFYAMAGGYGSLMLRADETDAQGLMSPASMASRYDFGLLAAGGLTLASSSPWGELFVEVRYQQGHESFLPGSGQKQQTISLLVGYGPGAANASSPSGGDRRFMLKGGMVATRFQAPDAAATSYVPGFAFGGSFSPVRVGSWIALAPQVELLFVNRGEHHGVMQDGSLSLDDVEASAQVRGELTFGDRVVFGTAGVYGSLTMRAHRNHEGVITSMRDGVNRFDAGFLVGAGVTLATFWDFTVSAEMRLQESAADKTFDAKQRSISWLISLSPKAPNAAPIRRFVPAAGVLYSANDQGEGSAQRSGRTVSVRIARLSDRWLQDLQFHRIAPSHRDGEDGYQVTYIIPSRKEKDKKEIEVFFWGRGDVDFDDNSPKSYRNVHIPLKDGRLVLPTRVTSESLPDVHRWIVELDEYYTAQTNGAIEAMEGFMVVAGLAGSKPALRAPPPRGAPRAGSRASATSGTARGATQAMGQGFRSFSEFKRVMGPAGEGMQWHHIVEQGGANVARFGAKTIHNTSNVVRVEVGVHRQISAFYSSKQGFTGGQTVREWLRTQSFDEQMEFGLVVLQRFRGAP